MKKQLELVVQINHKEHQRFERIVLASNKPALSFGRAWNSDVVLQDPYIDADHLNLSMDDDGTVVVADSSTVNGSLLNGKPLQQGGQAYRLGEQIQLGDTVLTIVDVKAAVQPALSRSGWFGLRKQFSSASSFIGVTSFTLLLSVLWSWGYSTEPYGIAEVTVSLFSFLLSLLVWSMFFGFISKLVRGQSNFRMHWVLACLALVTSTLVGSLLGIFKFNLQSLMVGEAITNLVYFLLGILFVYATLSYSTYLSSRSKWLCSIMSLVVIFAAVYSDQFLKKEHERWSQQTKTEQTTLPSALLVREPVSLDKYFDDVESTFEFEDLAKPE